MPSTILLPEEDLPQWMKQARRSPDYGLWLVLGFSLLLAWPFLLNPVLPATNANEHHVFRAQETAEAFEAGIWYPRWSPTISQGLGAPLPHYTPPASAYLGGLLTFYFTADATLSVRLLYIAAFLLAGSSTYLLVKSHANGRSGVIAALLYLYAPYLGQTVPHELGDLPQMLALALLPAMLWSSNRLLTRNLPLDVTILSLTSAALLWTSPLHFAVSLPLVMLLIVIDWPTGQARSRLLLLILCIECGIFITANFWFPLIWERDLVQWFAHPIAMPDYQVILSDLLRRHLPPDPAFAITEPQFRLGWPLLFFCASALLILIARRRALSHTLQVWMLLSGIGLIVVLMLLPAQVWLLGVATLCLSIGGSLIMHPRVRLDLLTQRLFLVSAMVILLGLNATIWFTVPDLPDQSPQYTSALDYEAQGFGILGLPIGQALPSPLPNPYQPTLLPQTANSEVQRLRLLGDQMLNSFTLSGESAHRYQYELPRVTTQSLRFLQANFAGWTALLNGENQPINPVDQDGVISITLNDSTVGTSGTLTIFLGMTPPRMIGWCLSIAAMLALLIISWRRWMMGESAYDESHLLNRWDSRYLGLVLFLMVAIIFLKQNSILLRSYEPVAGSRLSPANFMDTETSFSYLMLTGSSLSSRTWQLGAPTRTTLFWQLTEQADVDIYARLLLHQPTSDQRWAISSPQPIGHFPTRRITAANAPDPIFALVEDRHDIIWPQDLPLGLYRLEVEILGCEETCDAAAIMETGDDPELERYPLYENLRVD